MELTAWGFHESARRFYQALGLELQSIRLDQKDWANLIEWRDFTDDRKYGRIGF